MHSGHRGLPCFAWPLLPKLPWWRGRGCKATFAQLVQPQNKRKPTGCRTNLPLGPSSPWQALRPPAPAARTTLRSPFLTAHPGGSLPSPPTPSHPTPRTPRALSAHQQIPNSPQPFQEREGKKRERETMTSRAGLFGFVCLLVGSIKYSWKVNVPHTGEV